MPDYEEQKRWARLVHELSSGMNASEDEFVDFDPDQIIAKARQEKADDAS